MDKKTEEHAKICITAIAILEEWYSLYDPITRTFSLSELEAVAKRLPDKTKEVIKQFNNTYET